MTYEHIRLEQSAAAVATITLNRPQSLNALGRVSGVGAAKLERYGGAFVEVVRSFAG